MEELIAKRYVKAFKQDMDIVSLENAQEIFSTLAQSFNDVRFISIIKNPDVSKDQKKNLILDAVRSANSGEINNMIALLAEHNRLEVIPAIAEVLRKDVACAKKVYQGYVYSNGDIDNSVIYNLHLGLSKKYDSTIFLTFVKNDFDGIKVDVEDLGIEINFSKSRINNQIIEHIVKAI